MFRNPQEMRRRLNEIVETFRQKGATTPEKALTIQELGLPPRFEQAMHRRLGQLGIFVETNGKYYLNEDRLRQIQEQRAQRGGNRQSEPSWLRVAGILVLLPVGIIVVLAVFYFGGFGSGYFPGEILLILLVVMLVMFAARMMVRQQRRKYLLQNW